MSNPNDPTAQVTDLTLEEIAELQDCVDMTGAVVLGEPTASQLLAMAKRTAEYRAELGLTRNNLVRAFDDKSSARELPTSKLAQLLAERGKPEAQPGAVVSWCPELTHRLSALADATDILVALATHAAIQIPQGVVTALREAREVRP